MSFKTITTYLPSPDRVAALLDAVAPIVKQNDAHHVALHVMPRIITVYAGYAGVEYQVPIEVVERQEQAFHDEAKKAEQIFRDHPAGAGPLSEWRCVQAVHGELADDIIEQAICSDLIVISLQLKEGTGSWTELPVNIAMRSGRPVLCIPDAGKIESIGKRVLVAWNDSKEAVRAAFDAVPLLVNAETVEILAIEPRTEDGHDTVANGEELALALARHGVKTEATVIQESETSIGDELVSQLEHRQCDLLVMGSYGHSRFREAIFGGVTREVLQHMPVPVLFSH